MRLFELPFGSGRSVHHKDMPAGYYFITICTKRWISYFGIIANQQIVLSPIGKIAESELLRIPRIQPCIELNSWVIMPNHIHAIFHLLAPTPVGSAGDAVPPGIIKSGTVPCNIKMAVREFKSSVRRWASFYGFSLAWQSGFHMRIISDSKGLMPVKWYIRKNPAVWGSDVYYRELR